MSRGNFKLLAGLGNPGPSYANTRHNVGFMVLQRLAKKNSASFKLNKKVHGQLADIGSGEGKKWLLMPNTFMNESGHSIRLAMDWFGIEAKDVLILVDDIDLPLGKTRIRTHGSSGGHNGLKSIIKSLGTQEFCRLKIGIGHPISLKESRKSKTISHVLGKFNSMESELINQVLDSVIKGLELIHNNGLAIGTNYLNSYQKKVDL